MQIKVLDIEQSLLLLELDPPFDQRKIQLARRTMAKRWHPDIAPPGRRFEHESHLKAINEAADQLERLAEQSRGGNISKAAVKASAAAARRARAEAGRRAYEAEQRARAEAKDRKQNDPFGERMPDHSVVHRYARCLAYPEWGVGSVTGIYFSGDGETERQWARVLFGQGVRTVPAGSLQFVDFSKPDAGSDRVERFLTAAQHALSESQFELAAQRLIYARDAEPDNIQVLSLMAKAFWQAGNLPAAARTARDWLRLTPNEPRPHRYISRIYEDMGATELAIDATEKLLDLSPLDGTAWERLARLRMSLGDRSGAEAALAQAQAVTQVAA